MQHFTYDSFVTVICVNCTFIRGRRGYYDIVIFSFINVVFLQFFLQWQIFFFSLIDGCLVVIFTIRISEIKHIILSISVCVDSYLGLQRFEIFTVRYDHSFMVYGIIISYKDLNVDGMKTKRVFFLSCEQTLYSNFTKYCN